MFKILAINDVSKEEEHQEEEIIESVTKEAQETIAVSEYMRALQLKHNGKSEFALGLFKDLLRTQVVSDVPDDDKDNKLFSVKYNCYRNAGLIYEEQNELKLALENLVQASRLDDSDVFIQNKIGQIALKSRQLLLAQAAFEKCLERNPNHFKAKDGYLQVLCEMECIDQAYGFALKCYEQDRRYERAIRVLKEIRARFRLSHEYYDGIFGRKPVFDDNCKIEYDPQNSVFPPPVEIGFYEESYAILPDDFKMPENEMNWTNMGNFMLKAYDYILNNNHSLVSIFVWDDWIGKLPEKAEENMETATIADEPSSKVEENGENETKDDNEEMNLDDTADGDKTQGDDENQEETKKSKRRSDLDSLKEWGWHKNRRSTRKKQREEEEVVDTSINGFLRRLVPNYFVESFESNRSPFVDKESESRTEADTSSLNLSVSDPSDIEKFNDLTKDSFNRFIESFKNREFDIVIPVFNWLKEISIYWSQLILPAEIISIYKELYKIYESYIDYHSLYHMSEDEHQSIIRMAMFYFELAFDTFESLKVEIPDEFIRDKEIFHINLGFVDDDIECIKLLLRLVWMSYCIHIHNNNCKDALGFLYKIEEIFESTPRYAEIVIELKNCKNNNLIEEKTVKDLIVKIERKINLASVKKLYDTKNFVELIEILRESIIYSTEPKVNVDNLALKIQTQIEVFLECLWSLDRIEECLHYAEKSLKYSVDNFLVAPTEYRLEEWSSLANYCLVYIDSALREPNGTEILFSLGKNLSRLVQTLSTIIVHQLDSPIERNNPKSHLLNLTIPWNILYHVVLRESDIASSVKKSSEEEEIEGIPNTLLMLFTAHEFLGRKQWCMRENGTFLLNVLDILTPIYRTPLLEPFKDFITEYLEQTTYCLFGYPAKKAKLRHIEEHDAKNIDLSWERAIQIFDLYRPDNLPEFDSFKLQSISSEMEQLLQKIIVLIPKCLDITPFTCELKNFISGISSTLPKEISILPPKIASIYYLLADYYFKNQETGKAIKFYICDLTMKPDRFDSWASLSLCKQSKLEMKLNSNFSVPVNEFLEMADQAINCFNQCLKIKRTVTILTEFASFTYHLHSFCSRNLKQSCETLSMENFSAIEERKDRFLNISFKCFTEVNEMVDDITHEETKNEEESNDNHDEKWYYHFMLGKIAEKRKEPPINYLNHYIKSTRYLYEDNATYPMKINHGNPSHLAIESLEVFYRMSACIMKYLEQNSQINKPIAKLFMKVLKEMSTSAFAINRAKINKGNINAMKHKLNVSNNEPAAKQGKVETEKNATEVTEVEVQKMEVEENVAVETVDAAITEALLPPIIDETCEDPSKPIEPPIQPVIKSIISESQSRRVSQESVITTTTTTTSTRTSSSSDSSADSSSDSDSSSSDETTDGTDKENVFVSQSTIDEIYKMCIGNLEECVTRFPEHYKSMYRLIHHYATVGDSIEKYKQLLLKSDYKSALGNKISGLFSERKNNNFFNGIWRVPSQEIDRPGNFTTHLSKCVVMLMDMLKKTNDYETLMDLAMQLQRNPDPEKKYLNDQDRKDLFQQAIACCVQAFKNKLREIVATGKPYDIQLIDLMVEIFKAHRKTFKASQQKDQNQFTGVLVDVYKEYVKDKVTFPDNTNFSDFAFKMCQSEITYRKNLEKGIIPTSVLQPPHHIPPMQKQQRDQIQQQQSCSSTINQQTTSVSIAPITTTTAVTSTSSPTPLLIKSVSEINKSVEPPKSSQSPASNVSSTHSNSSTSAAKSQSKSKSNKSQSSVNANSLLNTASMNQLLQLYSNPAMLQQMQMSQFSSMDTTFLAEYMKSFMNASSAYSSLSSMTQQQQLGMLSSMSDPMMSSLLSSPYGGSMSPKNSPSPKSSPKTGSSSKDNNSSKKSAPTSTVTSGINSNSGGSNALLGFKQNLLSNSLTITTTTMTTVTSQKPTMSKPSQSAKKSSSKDSSSLTITKSDLNTAPMTTSKYMNYLTGTGMNLPELPKSLSITPSVLQQKQQPQQQLQSSKSQQPKRQQQQQPEKSKSQKSSPYSRTALTLSQEAAYSHLLNNQSASSLQAYQDFLSNYIKSHNQAPTTSSSKQQQQRSAQNSAAVVGMGTLMKQPRQKNSAHQHQQQQNQAQLQSSQAKRSQPVQPIVKPSTKIPYDFGKNIASSFSNLNPSPGLSISPFPPSSQTISPGASSSKTLQQKLAERKQKSQPTKKRDADDVIVLD